MDRIEAGMVTAQPIINEHGIVLCHKGSVLSEGLISKLKRLGIRSIAVEGEEPRDTSIDPEKIRREIEDRFSKVVDDPLMHEIKELVLKLKLGPVQGG